MNFIIDDLNDILNKGWVRDSYGTEPDKGRITRSAVNALLADVYLWKEDYESIKACDRVLADNNLRSLRILTVLCPGVLQRKFDRAYF